MRLANSRPNLRPQCRLGDEIRAAAREYAEEVRQGRFPAAEHTYSR
jgi:ketopantoate hydroxymethyltransferase